MSRTISDFFLTLLLLSSRYLSFCLYRYLHLYPYRCRYRYLSISLSHYLPPPSPPPPPPPPPNTHTHTHIHTHTTGDDGIKAKVQVFSGQKGGQLYEFTQPTENPDICGVPVSDGEKTCNRYWHVLNYDASTRRFEIINRFSMDNSLTTHTQAGAQLFPLPTSCSCSSTGKGLNTATWGQQITNKLKDLSTQALCDEHAMDLFAAAPYSVGSTTAKAELDTLVSSMQLKYALYADIVKDIRDTLKLDSSAALTGRKIDRCCKTTCGACKKNPIFGNSDIDTNDACYRLSPAEAQRLAGQSDDQIMYAYQPLFWIFENKMKSAFLAHPTLKWLYVGEQEIGANVIAPNSPRSLSSCATYDARLRPWYGEAASGAKDVVLIVDVSKSASQQTGVMEQIKVAAQSAIKPLNSRDRLNVILTGAPGTMIMPGDSSVVDAATYKPCQSTTLLPGIGTNKELLSRLIRDASSMTTGSAAGLAQSILKAQELLTGMKANDTWVVWLRLVADVWLRLLAAESRLWWWF